MRLAARIGVLVGVAGCVGLGMAVSRGAVSGRSDSRTAEEDAAAAAVQWFKTNQNPAGSWGSEWEFPDTADAVRALRELEPSAAAAATGAAWLTAQTASNHEYLARQILALTGLVLYQDLTGTLVDTLVAARNAAEWNTALPNWPEGGWGVDAGYETDCVTTAIALRALAAAGYAGGLARQNVALGLGEHVTYVFEVPADATQVQVRIDALTGDPLQIRLQEGSEPPLLGVPWFTIPTAPAAILYPDHGVAFTPGTNYLRIDAPTGASTFTLAVNYQTPSWDTATLEEPINYLREAQNGDDGWGLQRGTDSDIYSTLEVLLTLLQLPQFGNETIIAAGMVYVRAAQLGDGAFGYARGSEVPETALGAMVLMADDPHPFGTDALEAIAYLVANQDPGGSWNTAAYDTALSLGALNILSVSGAGAPSVVIDSTEAPGPTDDATIPVTVTFSLPVTGFGLSDVVVTNGTAAGLDDSSAPVYSLEITPAADGPHTVTVNVAAAVAFDVIGRGNQAAAAFQIVSDQVAPGVGIASAAAPATNTSPIPVTVTFDEPVIGFDISDIQVGNGTAANFDAGAAPVYTVDITPAGRGTVDVTVDVDAAAAQDAAGNDSTAAAQLSIRYDTDAPTVTVTSTEAPGPSSAFPIPVVVEFNESVPGFEAADITVINGVVTGFDDSSAPLYRVDVTAAGVGLLTVEVSVAGAATQDAAGNPNTASAVLSILFDEGLPTVLISSPAAPATSVAPIPVTVTFNEVVTGFDLGDISVTGGTAGSFDASGAPVYTAEIAPDLPGPTQITVDVEPNLVQDAAGNYNAGASTLFISYDAESPTVSLNSVAAPGPTNALPLPVHVVFSEEVQGFTNADVQVTNGTVTGFDDAAAPDYALEITPTSAGPLAVTVTVGAGVAADLAGNPNTAAPAALDFAYDGDPPTATLNWLGPFLLRIDFSETVDGAELTANYSSTPALTILGVAVVARGGYELTTERQTPGTAYSFDLADITDAAGNGVASALEFAASYFQLNFTDSEVTELDAGWSAAATDSFDVGTDATVPDPGNPSLAYAYLRNQDVADAGRPRLGRDIRAGGATRTGWRLLIDVPDGRGATTVTWDVSAAGPGTKVVLQRIENETCVGFPIDMTAFGGVVVSADREYEIAYGTALDFSLPMAGGWSLIGVPVVTDSTSGDILGGGGRAGQQAGPTVFYENGQYWILSENAPLSPERAYWVYMVADDGSRALNGVPADGLIRLIRGWNLISPVAACTMPLHPDLVGPAWRWDSDWQWYLDVGDGEELEPGNGYWLFLDADEALINTRP